MSLLTKVLLLITANFAIAVAAPSFGDEFEIEQPDGSIARVLIWGDEFYRVMECSEGYTLMRDGDGWINYAKLSDDKNEFLSTGVRFTNESSAPSGLQKGLHINAEAIRAKEQKAKENLGYFEMLEDGPRRHPRVLAAEAGGGEISLTLAAPEFAVGIVLIVDFPDRRAVHTVSEVDEFFNRRGGIGGTNSAGSVFDYFYDVSNGLMRYTNIVIPVIVTLPNNMSFYDNASNTAPLIDHAIAALNAMSDINVDLSGANIVSGRYEHLNIFFAGAMGANTLWAHRGTYNGAATFQGRGFRRYQISNMGSGSLSGRLGLVVHENGHLLMNWPDLYGANNPGDVMHRANPVARWCIMADSRDPTLQPNPWFRILGGWIDTTDITTAEVGDEFSHTANSATAFIYRRNAQEFYVIEARRRAAPRNLVLPGNGLAIWHIHTRGSNRNPTNPGYPYVRLMQADGRTDLENRINFGDITDLFRPGVQTKFNNTTTPPALWHDGTPSNIQINRISDTGAVMTFRIGNEDYDDSMDPKYRFFHDIADYARATENKEIVLDKDFTLTMLITVPAPARTGVTLTIRSANPAAPVVIKRGIVGNLFALSNGATVILRDVIIDGDLNGRFAQGGGTLVRINSGARFTMNNGTVLRNNNNNSAQGGGIIVNGGTFAMNGGEISGNTASSGGGVRVASGTATFENGVIQGIGRTLASVISGTHTLGGTTAVVGWNRPTGAIPTYTAGSATDLTSFPTGATTATWAIQGGFMGISYRNGTNQGFIRIAETGGATFIRNRPIPDGRHGILLENAIVSDFAKITVIPPEPATVNLRILDNLGNTVFTADGGRAGLKPAPTNVDDNATIVWNLTNKTGRFVGNGTYLIVAEAKGISGRTYIYSSVLGVRR